MRGNGQDDPAPCQVLLHQRQPAKEEARDQPQPPKSRRVVPPASAAMQSHFIHNRLRMTAACHTLASYLLAAPATGHKDVLRFRLTGVGRPWMALADPPDAIFCANDMMAPGFCDALRELSMRFLQDVAVIGMMTAKSYNLCVFTTLIPQWPAFNPRRVDRLRHARHPRAKPHQRQNSVDAGCRAVGQPAKL